MSARPISRAVSRWSTGALPGKLLEAAPMAGLFWVRAIVGVGPPFSASGARLRLAAVTPARMPELTTVFVPAPWLRIVDRTMLGSEALTLAELPVLPAAFLELLASLTMSFVAAEITIELISV